MKNKFSLAPWKHENDSVLHSPETGIPIVGKRVMSSSGFLVAEVYFCDENDIGVMIAAPEIFDCLCKLVAAIDRPKRCRETELAFIGDAKALYEKVTGESW